MKFLYLSIILLFQSILILAQVPDNQLKSPGTITEEENIQVVLGDFVKAWNIHDAHDFSMVFAEDADFTNVRGISVHGRVEVEKFHEQPFATRFKESSLKITANKIRFIKSDVAAVDTWWEMTGAKGPDGQVIQLRKGLLNFIMTKKGDNWFIIIMHNMDLPIAP
jgi:uncharacterized protein (TIGR02246 family)